MFPFYTPWKYQKTYCFLCFQEVEKWNIGWKWVKIQHKEPGILEVVHIAFFQDI